VTEPRVYRASSLGYSLCPLVASHLGYIPVDPPEFIQNAYDEGHRIEPLAIKKLRERGWEIADSQSEVGFTVVEGVGVLGHLDGIGGPLDAPMGVVEIKCMADAAWKAFDRHGWDAPGLVQKYKWQQSAYLLGSGLNRHYMVAWNKSTEELRIALTDQPFYSLLDIAQKLQLAEDFIEQGLVPDGCTDYPCPYFYLHESKDAKEVVEADSELETILAAWHEADKRAKIYEGEKKALREEIMRLVGSGDLAAPVIKSRDGVKVETYWQEGGPYSGVRQSKWVTKVSGPR
jgi:hypothetical protein